MNFAYKEHGEKKEALVKLRLCPECGLPLSLFSVFPCLCDSVGRAAAKVSLHVRDTTHSYVWVDTVCDVHVLYL